jgi:xanthine dehydrogenase accessory factor
MTTHRAIVDALSQAASDGDSVVLATVVRVTGSSYGGVGARMLIRVDGSTVGLVSGGCLESDLAEHARRASATGRAEVVRYDTRDDDDAPWGLGLGCNGLIDVLLEPLPPERAKSIASLLGRALNADTRSVLVTVIKTDDSANTAPSVGAHALLAAEKAAVNDRNADERSAADLSGAESANAPILTTGEWGSGSLLSDVTRDVQDALAAGRRGLVREHGANEVAFEVVHPAVQLIICGSGPDVVPISRSASQLGWDVTVVDHRPLASERSDRFPGARVVECLDATRLADAVRLTPHTAAVVMSHHIARDGGYVQASLAAKVAYIGVLGPRARTERMLADIAANTGLVSDTDDRVFAPVGMDIGGEGPEAIALAIIAEISAVLARRGGGHLRDRRGPLHSTRS